MIQPSDPPSPPPEANLIRLSRDALGLSVRAVAEKAGIGKTWLSQIEKGWQRRPGGGYDPVRASDPDLAHIAHVLEISPDRLRETGKDYAASILEEIIRREHHELPASEIPPQIYDIAAEYEEYGVTAEELWAEPRNRRIWQHKHTAPRTRIAMLRLAAARLADQHDANPGNPGWQQRA
jgi:transcriptional regulator with XRE-family HTH domain